MEKKLGRSLKGWKYFVSNVSLGIIEVGSVIGIDSEVNSYYRSYRWADTLTMVLTLFLI